MPQTYDIEALKAKYMPSASATPTPSNLGTSKDGQQYDVEALRQKYMGSTALPTATAPKTPQEEKDIESADKFKPTFASETDEGVVSTALKTIGNIPSSAWNFAKGFVQTVNPINTVKNIKEIVTAVPEIVSNAKYTGGAFNTAKDLGVDTAKSIYEGVVPEVVRSAVTGDIENSTRAVTNDPVGQILPLFLAAKGGAKIADRSVSKSNMADYVDNIGENTKNRVPIPKPSTKYNDMIDNGVKAVTKPIATVFGKAGEMAGGTTRTLVGQATGLNPETITQIAKTPEQFTKENMLTIDRRSLGQAVQSRLQSKIASLEETGSEYKPIRTSTQEVKVDKNFIDNSVKELAKVDVKKGKITTSGKADIRDAKDVRALQSLYDLWKPVFNKGKLTTEEFLNFRSDLAKLSKFERDLGKSAPIEGMTARMRAKFNEAYRPQIEGLDKLDEEFSVKTSELKRLEEGLVDKDGNLTPQSLNKIANASGKGKDLLLDRLEEVLPGVTQKIKILKAVEDIQHASGFKVATYGKGALIGGGLVMGGPIQAAITAILTSPELAVPIIRKYGLIKNSNAIKAVVTALQSGGNNVKDLMNNKPSAFNPSIKMPETLSAGLAVQDIFAGRSKLVLKDGVPLTKIANEKLNLADLKQKFYLLTKGGLEKRDPAAYQEMVKAVQDRGTFGINKPTAKVEKTAEKPVDTDNNTIKNSDGSTSLADPSEGRTYYHGSSAENVVSLLKNGIDVSKNKKGFAEQPEAFYAADKTEASMYGGDSMVGVRVKKGEKVKTINSSDFTAEENSIHGKTGKDMIKYAKSKGYDVINHGDELEIINPSKFEVFDPNKKASVFGTKKKVITESVPKVRPVPKYLKGIAEDIANSRNKKAGNIDDETYLFLDDWKQVDFGSETKMKESFATKPPSLNVINRLSEFKPKEKVKLYRGVRDNQKMGSATGYESWSYSKQVAKNFSKDGKVIEAIIDPKDILVDFKYLPKWTEDINANIEKEVIVKKQQSAFSQKK